MDMHFVDYVSFYNRLKRYDRKQFYGNNTGDEGNRIYRIQANYDIREDELVDSIMFYAEEDGFPPVIFGDDKYHVDSEYYDFYQKILYEDGSRLIIEVESKDGQIYYCDRVAVAVDPDSEIRPSYESLVAEANLTEEIQNELPELVATADYMCVGVIESFRPQDDPDAPENQAQNIMFESQMVYVNSGMPLLHFLEKHPDVPAEDIYCAIEDVVLDFHKAGYIHGTIESTSIFIKKDGSVKAKLANLSRAEKTTDAGLQAADIESLHALWTDTLNQTTELPSKKCRQKRAWTRRRHLVLPFMAVRGMTFNNTGRNERRKTRRLRRNR